MSDPYPEASIVLALSFALAQDHCFQVSLTLRGIRLAVRKDIVKSSGFVVIGAKGARTPDASSDEVPINGAKCA